MPRENVDATVVGGELRVVVGQLVRRLREDIDGGGLTKSQSSALGRLERDGPATATALARAEGMRPQSMAQIVATLTTQGYVTGSPDPSDGRKTILSCTRKAREHFRTGRLAREDWLAAQISAQLTGPETRQLHDAVALMQRLLTH